MKNLSKSWIFGTENVSKDAVEKHSKTEPHVRTIKLSKQENLGEENFREEVVMNSQIAKSFLRVHPADKNSLRVKFNTTYYVIIKERPFTDYPDLLKLQAKNGIENFGSCYGNTDASAYFRAYIGKVLHEDLKHLISKSNYYSVLLDGSTDSSVTEQETIYILLICGGVPVLKYFSMESVKVADSADLKETLEKAFLQFGFKNYCDKLVGLNLDGASVNMGTMNGLGKLVRDEAHWVEIVHCFNHRLELAIKDTFTTTIFYHNIDEMLTKLYYCYQKSPKRLQQLRELNDACEKSIPKPTKACGARWVDFKFQAMERILGNYGPYMTQLEQLSHSDSQPKKREEIKGYLNKWQDAGYIIHMAIFIDILSPWRRLNLSMQHENNDPVKIIRCINEFTWAMSKLRLIVENSLDGKENQVNTYLQNFISNVKKNNDEYFYQDIKLHKYETTIARARDIYSSTITNICSKVEARFSSLLDSVIFKNIPLLLDTSAWPKDDSANFGDKEINELSDHFNALLEKNGCGVQSINQEWIRLKLFILPILQNNQKESYLEIWCCSFANTELMSDCKNIMHLFEILLVVPFTNAIVEHLFPIRIM